jgi:hypothetical protein
MSLLTFNLFSLVQERTELPNRRPDGVLQMNVQCLMYDRPFLQPFLNWCRRHFTIGTTQKQGQFTRHVFGDKPVAYMPRGTFELPIGFYHAVKYDTLLSENGYLRSWLQAFLDSGMTSVEEFHAKNPYIAPPEYEKGTYNPPTNSHYGQLVIPRRITMPQFVGRDGFHLKRITELSHCEYLWFDETRHVVEIWGRENKIPKAQRMLEKRVQSLMTVPPPLPPPSCEFDLPDGLAVHQHNEYPRLVVYTMRGPEALCMQFFTGTVLASYPHNPYFTKISKKEQANGVTTMVVTR